MKQYEAAKMHNWEDLANAIVVAAAQDYRYVSGILRKHPYNSEAKRVKAELIQFFNSEWFDVLSEADAEYILRQLNREKTTVQICCAKELLYGIQE